ncbi:hypothetical protein SERLA73DRAFT_176148 [Serpula lacrymans var. lacrymans S7.3]|uniref:Poly A polymerase head domain-containing protein n=2 Tax=Serpula lacrymans var. lacrymans TaxID=341189 RepID=F8PME3_SERL3|nr:uncharacterized protein SERLADRAFT_458918 [Serpula lacrymans var. lacrymans S7.9]EGO02775.1 hypothetical protein SERLA73DRAFT_176148 [Serpula lacrymans var. lacrymans S7.3]EGO28476.1 hypothetical protein SERLADRAFT_458918 [Serpula lacrymans var. lacrymans S7.9]
MSSARIASGIKSEIELTEAENEVCTLLDECTRNLRDEHGITTSCRIAGGWVRDKLLGKQSNDIDIALTDMMGVTFAEHLSSYISKHKDLDVHKIAKIESNPGQSKHLETARTTLCGVELDFVNLRSEEYAENSRIPTEVAFGTPLQDALRRDITINALFYNVHDRAVEDHTNKGLDDLKNGIIRTPLEPLETFRDDPLRVLRCIRFASRFGFEMVPELREAARDPGIQEALSVKISRERVGEEIDKMMKGPKPLRSIKLIHELSLYSCIFSIPPEIMQIMSAPLSHLDSSLAATSVLHALISTDSTSISASHLPPLHPTLLHATRDVVGNAARLYLASALFPYHVITYTDKKKRQHLAVEAVLQEGLKLGKQNHYLDGIPSLFAAADLLKDPISKIGMPSERVVIGSLLREKVVHNIHTGSHWASSLLFSLVCEIAPLYDVSDNTFNATEATIRTEQYNDFVSRVEMLGLDKAVDAKHIVNGQEVVQALGGNKAGPWTGIILARVMEWQLEHPSGSKVDCIAWLQAEQAAGRIDVDELTASVVGNKRTQTSDQNLSVKKVKR